jgi:hypothetical protein
MEAGASIGEIDRSGEMVNAAALRSRMLAGALVSNSGSIGSMSTSKFPSASSPSCLISNRPLNDEVKAEFTNPNSSPLPTSFKTGNAAYDMLPCAWLFTKSSNEFHTRDMALTSRTWCEPWVTMLNGVRFTPSDSTRQFRRRTKSCERAVVSSIPLANDLCNEFHPLCVPSIRLPSDRIS